MTRFQWNIGSIKESISKIEENDTINIDLGIETLDVLDLLNKYLFSKRQDLNLFISTNKNDCITDDELLFLSKLKNVKKLNIFGVYNKTMEPLKDMTQLTYFATMHNKTLDIGFLENWTNLKEMYIHGKIKNPETIEKCIAIERLRLDMPIKSEDWRFLLNMKKLESVYFELNKKRRDEFEKLKKLFIENGKAKIIKGDNLWE